MSFSRLLYFYILSNAQRYVTIYLLTDMLYRSMTIIEATF